MATPLKCPNANCQYRFDPSREPPGSVLTCPTCGMRFQLPPPSPPPATAPTPTARKDRSPLFVTLGVSAVVGVAVSVGFIVLSGIKNGITPKPVSVFESAEFNFSFTYPGPPWEKDTAPLAATRLNLLTLKRSEGAARAGFAVNRFDGRTPLPGDLREPLLTRVRKLLDDPELVEEKGATWAGRPAVKYTFRGPEAGGETVLAGEAVAVGFQGIGYWFLAWSPEKEVAARADEFADIQERFKIGEGRPDWQEVAPPFAVFPGNAIDYRIVDTERVWKRLPGLDPKDEHPSADLVLRAEFPTARDFKPKADLVAYVLDPVGGDPLAALQKLIADRYAKETELFGPTKLTDISGEPEGDPPAHFQAPATPTVRMHADAVKDANRSKLLVLAAIRVENKVVAVEARCPWADRGLWERRLIHVAGSLRPGRR